MTQQVGLAADSQDMAVRPRDQPVHHADDFYTVRQRVFKEKRRSYRSVPAMATALSSKNLPSGSVRPCGVSRSGAGARRTSTSNPFHDLKPMIPSWNSAVRSNSISYMTKLSSMAFRALRASLSSRHQSSARDRDH